ncbi:unnamed protein product [Brassica rapa]|uniref:Uncharacterized protein n=1 Tax=Brassica campestris TaxID=3711 RepID=A0A8D9LUE1_BRACM|nr:unnamed protein product [Brassica rapa]
MTWIFYPPSIKYFRSEPAQLNTTTPRTNHHTASRPRGLPQSSTTLLPCVLTSLPIQTLTILQF